MSKHYTPPKQGMFGQIFDSILILVLVYASLMLPLLMKQDAKPADAPAATAEVVKVTWESLGQNAVEQAQWVKLGYDPDKAAALINSRFDYAIDPMMLIITIVVVVGYFALMLKISDKQYREVIAEKFDN
jgi:tryptophanyl-tRNA synthetase